jgi:CheY-like chemotaxis protein
MIERQVKHMARLIDDLLDVSRIARGKITLQKEEADLNTVVSAVIEDHRPLLDANGVTLEFTAPSVPLSALCDAARIAQIVSNLIVNANKFTNCGGRVSVELTSAEGGCAVITVRDTGIGMDADTLQRIFKPFAQAERSAARSRGGLGLGLALVKGLAELHGGSVRGSSPGLGQGSEFQVILPVLAQISTETSQKPEVAASQGRLQRVLIVEDNVDAAESLKILLEYSGHQVAVAHSGSAGIQQARTQKPEVVLCDVGLPGGMDGYAVAHAMREDPELRSTYLIAMTGYGQEEDRRRAKEAGFDVHLTKPIELGTLERLLGR